MDDPGLLEAADFLDLGRCAGHGIRRRGQPERPALARWRRDRCASRGHNPGGACRMKAGVRKLLFILPVLLFVALAAYFALALRSGDPHELPSALLDKEAP